MELKEKIKSVNLRPSDVVKLTGGDISLSQASVWISTGKMTKATEQLLWRLCDEKVSAGLSFNKPGRKSSELAEIFQQKTEEVRKEQQGISAKAEQPTKRTLKLKPTGVNTMDPPMTKKLRTVGTDSFWFLYGTKNKYKLSEKDQDCILDLEEGTFTLNDFETR